MAASEQIVHETDGARRKLVPVRAATPSPLGPEGNKVFRAIPVPAVLVQPLSLNQGRKIHFVVTATNAAFSELYRTQANTIPPRKLEKLFPGSGHTALYSVLHAVKNRGNPRETNISFEQDEKTLTLQVNAAPFGSNILCTFTNISRLARENVSLQARIVELAKANTVQETGRSLLQKSVSETDRPLKNNEIASVTDTDTGVANRRSFMERGSAEMQRARRYDHALSLIVLTIEDCGEDGTDPMLATGMAQVFETLSRAGVDTIGRIDNSSFGLLLPETHLSGAMHLAARLQKMVRKTKFQTETGSERIAVIVKFGSLEREDNSFREMLSRVEKQFEPDGGAQK